MKMSKIKVLRKVFYNNYEDYEKKHFNLTEAGIQQLTDSVRDLTILEINAFLVGHRDNPSRKQIQAAFRGSVVVPTTMPDIQYDHIAYRYDTGKYDVIGSAFSKNNWYRT